MARSRNIKPGFFTNDTLSELPPLARLLFAGLWTLCDRDGRCEDRPKKIKAEVLPYDECDADALLAQLASAGFIDRYEAMGQRVIQVLTWGKHQNPHVKEAPSALPVRCESGANPVQEPGEQSPSPERAGLIPDSGFLIPDPREIPIPVGIVRAPSEPPQLVLVEKSKPKKLACPHLEVLRLWAELLPAMPQHSPDLWNGARSDHLRVRWNESAASKGWKTEDDGLRFFRRLFAYVGQSPFLTGRNQAQGKRPFVIELEWLVKPANWAKVLEGKYHSEAA